MTVPVFYLVFIVALPWVLCFLAKVTETIVYKMKLRGCRKRHQYISGLPTNSKFIKREFADDDKTSVAVLLIMSTVTGVIWLCLFFIVRDDLMTAIKYKL